MRTKVIDCLDRPALDAAAAEATGWRWIAYPRPSDGKVTRWLVPPDEFKPELAAKGSEPVGYLDVPKYSTDYAIAKELEFSLSADLHVKFIEALITVCQLDVELFDSALERERPDVSVPDALWALIHASALQRTLAFLLACGIEHIET